MLKKKKFPPEINGDPTQISLAHELRQFLQERAEMDAIRNGYDYGFLPSRAYILFKESLYRNVRRNLENDKKSRYLMAKSSLLYRLAPAPQTENLVAQANWRYYDSWKNYRGLERRLKRFAAKKKGIYRTCVDVAKKELHERIQWDVKITEETKELAEVLTRVKHDDRVGVLYDAAMAFGRYYHDSSLDRKNPDDLERAREYINEASVISGGQTEWVEALRNWLSDMPLDRS